tara:strand:- start:436 stop:1014 length:579 start_codon:yes stop_codon:yes gene_type:complete
MLPPILQRVKDLGHEVFTDGDYDLNIVGIRTESREANKFDDIMTCTYKQDGTWITKYWPCTTDPGTYHLDNPYHVVGTAILVPGQYRGVYKLDLHSGKYLALCQRNGKVKVYRDPNKDEVLDMDPDTIQEGFFGINIHRASSKRTSTQVDRWSAGCQVFASHDDLAELLTLAKFQQDKRGWPSFTYTLIEED